MGRGETSDVNAIPTLPRLLSDIDGLNATTTDLKKKCDDLEAEIDTKIIEEREKVIKYLDTTLYSSNKLEDRNYTNI